MANTISCGVCGDSLTGNTSFCGRCGSKIETPVSSELDEDASLLSEIESDITKVIKLTEGDNDPTKPKWSKKQYRISAIIWLVLIVVFIVVFAALALSD